jgi:hypothetical protein
MTGESVGAAAAPGFGTFLWRVCATHVLTYFVSGLLAYTLLDYTRLFSETELRHLMRPTSSPWVAAGPSLQVVRGTLLALVLWPFAELLVARTWLVLWALLVGLSVLGTSGPTPGSLEGVLFTTLPPHVHLLALPEVVLQTGAFSFLLLHWCHRPARWKDRVAGAALGIVALMSLLGVLAAAAPPLSP